MYFCNEKNLNIRHLTELHIELSDVSTQEFYGANNENFKLLKTHFPNLKLIGRGKKLSAVGEESHLNEFSNKLTQIIEHLKHYNRLNENDLERLLDPEYKHSRIKKSEEILVHGVSGRLIKALTPGQKKLVELEIGRASCREREQIR